VQYLLAESLVLATLGGAVGAFVVFAAPAVLAWWFGGPLEVQFRPDLMSMGTTAALCFATSLVFGMLPAIRFSRPWIIGALKDEAGGGRRRVGRVHRMTAALQAGFAVPFLVICGVMLDQVRVTATLDLGFETSGLYFVPLDLGTDASGGNPDFLLRAAQSNLQQAAGVSSVAIADGVPLDSSYRVTRVAREGASSIFRAHTTRISPAYLQTVGGRVTRGREFTADDRAGAEPVVILSEPLATQLFPEESPLGHRLTLALEGDNTQTCTVVGVAADHVGSHLGTAEPQIFVPLAQHATSRVLVIARSAAPKAAMVSVFEDALADFKLDPGVIRSSLGTADDRVRNSRMELAVGSTLAGLVGAVALLLAGLGVFGVVGFMVATRTREIGIRIALGASRPQVLGGVLFDALKLAAPGVGLGLLLAIPLARALSWYAVGFVEPLVYIAAAAVTVAVALLAGLPAARRAASVEPMVAMRAE
jgi:predicted permease